MKKKVLNLYCGVGGNRKEWGDDYEITAVELNPEIAEVYKSLYPNDILIVGDAHEYLLNHFKEFNFIWASPPCPSHSRMRTLCVGRGQSKPIYIDCKLYQEIILLKHNFKGHWVIENVKPYYEPLIKPTFELERHYWWSSFYVKNKTFNNRGNDVIKRGTVKTLQEKHGIDLSSFDIKDKRKLLRNCVNPKVGKYIFDCYLSQLNDSSKLENKQGQQLSLLS